MTRSFQECQEWHSCLATLYGHAATKVSLDPGRHVLLSRFSRWPIAAVYPGFPASRDSSNSTFSPSDIELLKRHASKLGADLMRWSCDNKNHTTVLPTSTTIETRIDKLAGWPQRALRPEIRRNIRKAENYGIYVQSNAATGRDMYRLYSQTIAQHRGKERYNQAYFDALETAARKTPSIEIISARSKHQIAAYIVIAFCQDWVYYLHGATDASHRESRPMDLIFYQTLSRLASEGYEVFNFLSSPRTQPGLVRYKEKWGGISYSIYHYSLPCSLKGRAIKRFGL